MKEVSLWSVFEVIYSSRGADIKSSGGILSKNHLIITRD